MTISSVIQKGIFSERTLMGIVTYDSEVHVYNMRPGLSNPKMIVISNFNDGELPFPVNRL